VRKPRPLTFDCSGTARSVKSGNYQGEGASMRPVVQAACLQVAQVQSAQLQFAQLSLHALHWHVLWLQVGHVQSEHAHRAQESEQFEH
jgi:hypothetical protein